MSFCGNIASKFECVNQFESVILQNRLAVFNSIYERIHLWIFHSTRWTTVWTRRLFFVQILWWINWLICLNWWNNNAESFTFQFGLFYGFWNVETLTYFSVIYNSYKWISWSMIGDISYFSINDWISWSKAGIFWNLKQFLVRFFLKRILLKISNFKVLLWSWTSWYWIMLYSHTSEQQAKYKKQIASLQNQMFASTLLGHPEVTSRSYWKEFCETWLVEVIIKEPISG